MKKILIKNGRVWDGYCFSQKDIYIEDGIVAAIEPSICCQANYVADAEGKLVTPGLIDVHAHFCGLSMKRWAASADLSCLPFGVTAAAEAGACFFANALAENFVPHTFVFCLARVENNQALLDQTEQLLAHYGHRALGIKICFDDKSGHVKDLSPLQQVCDFAHARDLKVMVHCTNSPVSMAQVVDTLHAGDILSHAFHGGKNTAAKDGFACLRKAKEKGVFLDAAFAGSSHVSFQVFSESIQSGILPDSISTDLTCESIGKQGGRYGMTQCMTMASVMGMQEEDILRATTTGAAKVLGRPELGILAPGYPADLAILEWTTQPLDITGNPPVRLYSEKGYRCRLAMISGYIAYVD